MKSLFAILLTACISSAAFAFNDVTPIPVGSDIISVAPITELESYSAAPICPKVPGRMSCLAVGSRVEAVVVLGSCVNKLGPVTYTVVKARKNKFKVLMSVTELISKRANEVRCFAPQYAKIGFHIPQEAEVIEVELLNSQVGAQE